LIFCFPPDESTAFTNIEQGGRGIALISYISAMSQLFLSRVVAIATGDVMKVFNDLYYSNHAGLLA
jgi:hypothetical protein